MVAVAYVAPSPKALRDPNLKDRVILSEADPSHPATPERPDGGEIFIAANDDHMPTLVALTGGVQQKLADGLLVQVPEDEALTRRRDVVAGKIVARQRTLALAAQDRPLTDDEARALIRAQSEIRPPDDADLQDTPASAGTRQTVAQVSDRVGGASSAADLDAIAAEEAAFPGGPRKGVTDAIERRRQQLTAAGQ